MRARTRLGGLLGALFVAGAVLWLVVAGTAAGGLTADDYEEIRRLYARYYHAIDAGEADAWADTFTPDGSFTPFGDGRRWWR